jgi:hypothetical protein
MLGRSDMRSIQPVRCVPRSVSRPSGAKLKILQVRLEQQVGDRQGVAGHEGLLAETLLS